MNTGRILGKQLGEPLFDLPLTLPEMALHYLITTNEKLVTEGQNQVYAALFFLFSSKLIASN